MAASKCETQPQYIPLPSDQNYVVLPLYYPCRRLRLHTICTVCFMLFAATAYVLWPSDPDIKVVRMHLNRIHVHTSPHVAIDVSMSVTVKVRNADVYSMEYRALDVTVGYRGKRLGRVRSDNGSVRARGASYVEAELDLEGVEVFSDVVFLLEDLAKGAVPFTTVTEVQGRLGLLFFQFPLQSWLLCAIYIRVGKRVLCPPFESEVSKS
ncbi:hypothetical protein FNV43_RR06856 [Rhamnella rubrinervis]|uniref:Late embryogenesis abundant protein LEA-2 subgroup domain-containing protein n=1 Tax=Rhamnella rubrinervis TaxID=2594499 RepID=A0A8K0HDP4_9ROSA|nr:hypothetical protein FNV43_RR06856 [Rhamnella rubrinervis]